VSTDVFNIRKIKRPDGNQLWQSYRVAEDDHGSWLYTPQGSLVRGTKAGKSRVGSAGEPVPPGVAVIHLVPDGEWWFARWQVSPLGVAAVAVDVCLPPQLIENEWSYVDLELDLFKSSDGIAGLFDQEDFDRAVEAGHISPDEQAHALAVAEDLERRIVSGDPLFDELGWVRYDHCVSLSLPPLTDV